MTKRLLGIFVEPIHAQSEGIRSVFDVLDSIGATAIALTLNVGRPAAPGAGRRMPYLHMDGHRRVYSRPVWGRNHLDVEFFPAFDPDTNLFAGTVYRPRASDVPSDVDRSIPRRMVDEAHRRGIEAYVQLKPFMPPGLRREDQPVYPDGTTPVPPQVAMIGTPSSSAIRTYGSAVISDTLRHFGDVEGLFLDWAEFGAYTFEDLFTCVGPHSANLARALGYDWDAIATGVRPLWDTCHRLTGATLRPAETAFHDLFESAPGWPLFLRFKSEVIATFYKDVRTMLDRGGYGHVRLMARGWPPPWNAFSGLAYEKLAEVCHAATPKLFAFDYCALPRWYGQTIQRWNPALCEQEILDALVMWLDLPDDFRERRFDRYVIPAEDEKHPVGIEAYRRRVEAVMDAVKGKTRIQPFAHAHMPDAMWREKVRMLLEREVDGMWVQMYGYLSESKLQILREECKAEGTLRL